MTPSTLPARLSQQLHPAGSAPAPVRLVSSWERSRAYGVSTEQVEPVFTGTFDEASLFIECGRQVLGDLHQTLIGEPVSLMLTDADGLVLDRLSGDTSLLRALDRVHLAPGFSYAEREAGTNGLGLALADRAPTVVRAEQHFAANLCRYTCAAVPVIDPITGRLEGAVNLTTWSEQSTGLLLALAESAAGNTASLMLARSRGRRPRPAPRGEVFRMESARLEPGSGTLAHLGAAWSACRAETEAALAQGRTVLAVGEPGSGRATVIAQALRAAHPRHRILCARVPQPHDVDTWMALWCPEVGKPHTAVVVAEVDDLPVRAAARLRDVVRDRAAASAQPILLALTADRFEDLPAPLTELVDTVVAVPALRERPADVVPLARHLAQRVRHRDVDFTAAAEHALRDAAWPGNIEELAAVVRHAAARTDNVDVRHLPASVLSGSRHRLSRIETFERDEIIRVLTAPDRTMAQAAEELGMSRATIYRKLAQYDIHLPKS